MAPDFVCTWWFSGWWLHCCINHDLGASDESLWLCVFNTAPSFIAGFAMATIMYVGLKLLGPVYRLIQRMRNR